MWITCLLCGSLVADVPTHAHWHDVPVGDVVGPQTPPPAGHTPPTSPDGGIPDGD